MADVVVTRADLEAAARALGWDDMTYIEPWLAQGGGDWFAARDGKSHSTIDDYAVAKAIAAARAAERERCAGMVREMARWADAASKEAHHARKEHDCDKPAYLEGREDTLDEVMRMAGDLAERIGKGEA